MSSIYEVKRMLTGKTVLLGVTGSIAVYKICNLARMLTKLGAEVHVAMTPNTQNFVHPLTFETLTQHKCLIDTFDRNFEYSVEHVSIAKKADVVMIAPASANVIGKIANGIADDMLSTTLLATKAPVLVAPAMNTGMYTNPATQQNMETLRSRGIHFVEPETGALACGDVGAGRLADVWTIKERAMELLTVKKDLAGLRIAVTAGPTQEAIDPVRYISNRSSGKMGYAIARAAQQRGAQVTLLSGPVSLNVPSGVTCIQVKTTRELYEAAIQIAREQDVIIQAAAPADFGVKEQASQKIKKDGSGYLKIDLTENPDVAAELGRMKTARQVLIGFAAETNDVEKNAAQKLHKKNLDLIVANDVSQAGAGFDVDTNIVTFYTKDGSAAFPILSKEDVAHHILDWVVQTVSHVN